MLDGWLPTLRTEVKSTGEFVDGSEVRRLGQNDWASDSIFFAAEFVLCWKKRCPHGSRQDIVLKYIPAVKTINAHEKHIKKESRIN